MAIQLTKDEFQSQMRDYLSRDVAAGKAQPFILGFKVWARTDLHWLAEPCPRGAGFVGLYLPDELPQLYPDDCPAANACCCLLHEHVFDDDNTLEVQELRDRMMARGLVPPVRRPDLPPLTPEKEAELLALVAHAIQTLPEEKEGLWRFVGGLFKKKT